MRHTVTYQRNKAAGLDGYGQPNEDWQSIVKARARIQTLTGAEIETANKHHAEATHVMTHRFTSKISVRDRINFSGRLFMVLHIDNYEQLNQEQRVLCVEQVKT